MVPDWMAFLIVCVITGYTAIRFPGWMREAKEDQERFIAWGRELELKRWYRNIPARLDKWQQERNSQ